MMDAEQTWTFEELGLEDEYERVNSEYHKYAAKRDLLNEMISERFKMKDFNSETVQFLEAKENVIREKTNIFCDVSNYLSSLKRGYPFHVSLRIGRLMTKFNLTREQSELFLEIHMKHLSAMGEEMRKKYTFYRIKNIVWDLEEDCLKVHYDDIWWHYEKDHTWW